MKDPASSPNNLKGAILGGLLMAIPSALPLVSCCCFIWGLAGGALAAFVAGRSAVRFGATEGLLAGLAAVVPGVVLYEVIQIPVNLVFAGVIRELMRSIKFPPNFPPQLVQQLRHPQSPLNPIAILISLAIMSVAFLVLSSLGGLIGGLATKKDEPLPGDGGDSPAPPAEWEK